MIREEVRVVPPEDVAEAEQRALAENRAIGSAERIVDIVFDGPPSMPAPRYVEVEDAITRESIRFGEWVERGDGYWALRFTLPPEGATGQ